MDLRGCGRAIIAEHEVQVVVDTTTFSTEVEDYQPYKVTEGYWVIQPQHLLIKGGLKGDGPFDKAFSLVSYQALSGNRKPLCLFSFTKKELEEGDGALVFHDQIRPRPITYASNSFFFQLRTVGGGVAHLVDEDEGKLLLGFSLIQLSRKAAGAAST